MKGIKIFDGFWRESGRPVRFFFISSYAVAPMMLFLLHIRYWTLGVFVGTLIAMFVMEQFGFTPPVAILAIRSLIAGRLVKRRKSMFNKRLDN